MFRASVVAFLLATTLACRGLDPRSMDLSDPSVLASHQKKQLETANSIVRATDSLSREMARDEAALQLVDHPSARTSDLTMSAPVDSLEFYRAQVDSLRALNRTRLVSITHLRRQLDALGPGVKFVNDSLQIARGRVAQLEELLVLREQRITQLESQVDSLMRVNGMLVQENHDLRDTIVVLRDTIFGLRRRVDSITALRSATVSPTFAITNAARYVVLSKGEVQRLDLLNENNELICANMPARSIPVDRTASVQLRLPEGRNGFDIIGRPDLREMQEEHARVWSYDDRAMLFTINDADRFWDASSCLVFVQQ